MFKQFFYVHSSKTPEHLEEKSAYISSKLNILSGDLAMSEGSYGVFPSHDSIRDKIIYPGALENPRFKRVVWQGGARGRQRERARRPRFEPPNALGSHFSLVGSGGNFRSVNRVKKPVTI